MPPKTPLQPNVGGAGKRDIGVADLNGRGTFTPYPGVPGGGLAVRFLRVV